MSDAPIPLRYAEESGDRRGQDRRAGDRRASKRDLDPLFAATLVNQLAPAETVYTRGYALRSKAPRPGIVVNVSA